MRQPALTLRGFTRGDLPRVEAWFLDADTRRYLGGPQWSALMLDRGERVVGPEFRGAVQAGAYRYYRAWPGNLARNARRSG